MYTYCVYMYICIYMYRFIHKLVHAYVCVETFFHCVMFVLVELVVLLAIVTSMRSFIVIAELVWLLMPVLPMHHARTYTYTYIYIHVHTSVCMYYIYLSERETLFCICTCVPMFSSIDIRTENRVDCFSLYVYLCFHVCLYIFCIALRRLIIYNQR